MKKLKIVWEMVKVDKVEEEYVEFEFIYFEVLWTVTMPKLKIIWDL